MTSFEDWPRTHGVRLRLDEQGGAIAKGWLKKPNQTDWYEFTAPRAGQITVRVTGEEPDFTEFVRAFRSAGGGIDTHSGVQEGEASVTFPARTSERFVLCVESLHMASKGHYTIRIETALSDETAVKVTDRIHPPDRMTAQVVVPVVERLDHGNDPHP